MRPDAQDAFRKTLANGPSALPSDLLAGERAAQLRGMRAYANTISHARFVALEHTFPRTRELLGAEAFHAASTAFLETPSNLGRPVRLIGTDFPGGLQDPAARDLATAEWAWLDAHGAADAPAVRLADLNGIAPDRLVAARVMLHPAARLVTLETPIAFRWNEEAPSEDALVLITRPDTEIQFTRLPSPHARLFEHAARPQRIGDLLEMDADGVTALLQAGALTPVLELL